MQIAAPDMGNMHSIGIMQIAGTTWILTMMLGTARIGCAYDNYEEVDSGKKSGCVRNHEILSFS